MFRVDEQEEHWRFASAGLCPHFIDSKRETQHRINFVQLVFDLLWFHLSLRKKYPLSDSVQAAICEAIQRYKADSLSLLTNTQSPSARRKN